MLVAAISACSPLTPASCSVEAAVLEPAVTAVTLVTALWAAVRIESSALWAVWRLATVSELAVVSAFNRSDWLRSDSS